MGYSVTDVPTTTIPAFPFQEFKYVESPNPGYTTGQRVDATEHGKEWVQKFEEHGTRFVKIADENPRYIYQLMKSGLIPRPIAFVSSVSEDGVENLAPFSYFTQVGTDPPVVLFVGSFDPRGKDSVRNARTTKQYTINIISEPWTEQSNMAAIDAPPNVSEWDFCGLTKMPSVYVKAPRVKESAFSMEVEFLRAIELFKPSGDPDTVIVLGTVLALHIREDMFNDRNIVDPAKLKPVSRLGDITFSSIGPGYRVTPKMWEKTKEDIDADASRGVHYYYN